MPLANRCSGGGPSFAAIIYVTYTAGATCTCSKGSETLTAPDTSGSATFIVKSKGTWTVTTTLNSRTESENVSITSDGQTETVEVFVAKIYGISRNITSSSPAWARTDDAVGLTATASVGTSAGASDFDNLYPWSEIQREKPVTQDLMVKIPKFWYRRYREGNIEYIKIADREIDGFALHPAFNHAGTPKECVYVGAYLADNYGQSFTQASVSGGYPSTLRATVSNKGTGWGLLDISTLSAIQMLMLVEFATNNMQTAIGNGYTATTYDKKTQTGNCDSVPKLTGCVSTNGNMVWRGIEDVWGNGYTWIDGVIYVLGSYYVSNDPSKYALTYSNFSQLSYSTTAQYGGDYYYITQLGLDTNYPYIMLPTTYSSGSATTYFCDAVAPTHNSGSLLYAHGGAYDDSTYAGLFYAKFQSSDGGSGNSDSRASSRIMYIPQ